MPVTASIPTARPIASSEATVSLTATSSNSNRKEDKRNKRKKEKVPHYSPEGLPDEGKYHDPNGNAGRSKQEAQVPPPCSLTHIATIVCILVVLTKLQQMKRNRKFKQAAAAVGGAFAGALLGPIMLVFGAHMAHR